MKFRTAEIATGVIFLVYSILYIFYITPNFVTNALNDSTTQTIAWTLRPEALPNLNIGVFIVCTFVMIFQAMRSQPDADLDITQGSFAKLVFVIGWAFLYSALLPIFGFMVLSPIFMAVLIMAFGLRDWRYVLGVSIAMPLLMEYFFFHGFQIILPEGRLWK